MTEYVAMAMMDFKNGVQWMYFLQWNGNEKPLTRIKELCDAIEAKCETTDNRTYDLDIKTRVPQSVVDLMVQVEWADHGSFIAIPGIITLPPEFYSDDFYAGAEDDDDKIDLFMERFYDFYKFIAQ